MRRRRYPPCGDPLQPDTVTGSGDRSLAAEPPPGPPRGSEGTAVGPGPERHEQGRSADGTSRRSLITGAAAVAALAGAGAGAGAGALLGRRVVRDTDQPRTSYRLAPGSVPGGDGGPWRYVAPGGSIQATIDSGAVAIQLGDGTYGVPEPIRPTSGCVIRGVGQRTRLVATASMPSVIAIGDGGPIEAVQVSDLLVACDQKAATGIDLNIVGTAGFYSDEPDAVCRLDGLWVYDAADDGIVYRGTDTQACVSSRIRVRRARRHGFRIEAPDNVWIACEATTSGPDGAGFYVGTAIDGSNGIGAGNVHFHACKAWYCRGLGWHVTGSRTTFVGCESQDTARHGWLIEAARNAFSACVADTAGMADVGGKPDSADGFNVVPDQELTLVGCMAFDRRPEGAAAQQRYGFHVPAALLSDGLLVAHTGWGNAKALVHRR